MFKIPGGGRGRGVGTEGGREKVTSKYQACMPIYIYIYIYMQCRWFESHLRQPILFMKMTVLVEPLCCFAYKVYGNYMYLRKKKSCLSASDLCPR